MAVSSGTVGGQWVFFDAGAGSRLTGDLESH